MCGATIPARLAALLQKFGGQATDMEKAGIEYASEQIADLVAHGVDGIHLYTMNKPVQTKINSQTDWTSMSFGELAGQSKKAKKNGRFLSVVLFLIQCGSRF